MTNVGLIGIRNKSGEMKAVTGIADSQGTNQGLGTKDDTNLKIFTVGDDRRIMLLGTGSADVIISTADALRKQKGIGTVEEASQAVLEYTHYHYSKMTKGKPETLPGEGFATDFILGGPGKNDLEMTLIDTTGFNGNPKTSKYKNRGIEQISVERGNWYGVFRGSAFRHINNYISGQSESGRPIIIESIADGLVEMYDLSLRGARDLGVNDKLHFGVITPDKTVRLVHPETQFKDLDSHIEQLVNLTGLNIGGALGEMFNEDPVKESEAIDLSRDASRFSAGFYYALSSELKTSSGLKSEFTRLSEKLYRNPKYVERFNEIIELRRNSLGFVKEGVDAMLSGDASKMREYMESSDNRRKKVYDNLISAHSSKK